MEATAPQKASSASFGERAFSSFTSHVAKNYGTDGANALADLSRSMETGLPISMKTAELLISASRRFREEAEGNNKFLLVNHAQTENGYSLQVWYGEKLLVEVRISRTEKDAEDPSQKRLGAVVRLEHSRDYSEYSLPALMNHVSVKSMAEELVDQNSNRISVQLEGSKKLAWELYRLAAHKGGKGEVIDYGVIFNQKEGYIEVVSMRGITRKDFVEVYRLKGTPEQVSAVMREFESLALSEGKLEGITMGYSFRQRNSGKLVKSTGILWRKKPDVFSQMAFVQLQRETERVTEEKQKRIIDYTAAILLRYSIEDKREERREILDHGADNLSKEFSSLASSYRNAYEIAKALHVGAKAEEKISEFASLTTEKSTYFADLAKRLDKTDALEKVENLINLSLGLDLAKNQTENRDVPWEIRKPQTVLSGVAHLLVADTKESLRDRNIVIDLSEVDGYLNSQLKEPSKAGDAKELVSRLVDNSLERLGLIEDPNGSLKVITTRGVVKTYG